MIKREKYMKPIREFYDGDLIKVITGIRRCGKSVILKQILEEIKERSDNIIFLDQNASNQKLLCFYQRLKLEAFIPGVHKGTFRQVCTFPNSALCI